MLKNKFLLIFLSSFLVVPFLAFAEDITITTYYPSPYGSYRELRSARMAIGDNYIDGVAYTWEATNGDGGEVDYQADLVVEGNVGIGTANPSVRLQVERPSGTASYFNAPSGTAVIAEAPSGTAVRAEAPSGFDFYGLGTKSYFAGNVGIGTTDPGTYKLNVNGNVWVGGGSGVSATIFRDLNAAYFLNPDPGSAAAQSAEIRGRVRVGPNSGGSISSQLEAYSTNYPAISGYSTAHTGVVGSGSVYGVTGATGSSGTGVDGSGQIGVRGSSPFMGGYDFYGNGPRTYFSGNVGIGTTAPAAKLEVHGNLTVVGNVHDSCQWSAWDGLDNTFSCDCPAGQYVASIQARGNWLNEMRVKCCAL